ncbi:MAG: NAD(P)-dependent oxidoreductase [Phycisphaeraceae bacterium]
MNKPKVILTEHLDDAAAQWLADQTHLVRQPHDDPVALHRELADAEGLVVRTYTLVNDALLDAAPRLKVVGRAGVGLDNIDLPACRRRDVRVVFTPDANTQAVVEYLWALILDVVRPRKYLTEAIDAKTFHAIRAKQVGKQLSDMTLGILGVGRIGRRIAQVASAIGMRVLCNDILKPDALDLPPDFQGLFVDKSTLYRESDILTIHVDGRPENRQLIDAAALSQLKNDCLLINAARGMLIDNAALRDWSLRVRTSGGEGLAVLDVHEPEPPQADYILYGLPNVKLLPHLASRTPQAMANMSWVVRDVVAVLRGEPPRYPAV